MSERLSNQSNLLVYRPTNLSFFIIYNDVEFFILVLLGCDDIRCSAVSLVILLTFNVSFVAIAAAFVVFGEVSWFYCQTRMRGSDP